jgi:hypothetical protein
VAQKSPAYGFGAPVRLRLARQLGYKNTKYLAGYSGKFLLTTGNAKPFKIADLTIRFFSLGRGENERTALDLKTGQGEPSYLLDQV